MFLIDSSLSKYIYISIYIYIYACMLIFLDCFTFAENPRKCNNQHLWAPFPLVYLTLYVKLLETSQPASSLNFPLIRVDEEGNWNISAISVNYIYSGLCYIGTKFPEISQPSSVLMFPLIWVTTQKYLNQDVTFRENLHIYLNQHLWPTLLLHFRKTSQIPQPASMTYISVTFQKTITNILTSIYDLYFCYISGKL